MIAFIGFFPVWSPMEDLLDESVLVIRGSGNMLHSYVNLLTYQRKFGIKVSEI
jgi:hypothetical protein